MASDSLSQRKAQLDTEEREHLEDVVTEMRERVEDNVEFQLTQQGLDDEPGDDLLDEDTQQLVEAIELEAVDGESWSEAFEQYVTGVGYTIVNRLAALRCMEVRDFIDEEVTVFKENGLTPAAETLVREEFLLEDEAILTAYHDACDDLAEEIEILFDRSSAYSLIDPDDDTFEELCGMLDEVPDEVWRADDVLGWVYEYYNVKLLDDLRRKGDREGLEPEDVPPANQFYTPHWVVRMLTDNSLGKLYLEHTGELQDVVETQEEFSPDERKNRPLSPDESPDIADFCTYLVPSEEEGEPTDFAHPEELRVIDPACGSGHFLLYAFDVLERIWRAETNVADDEIPRKILQHNIYGVDLDMRACQLAAFNLYLKGRTRAEAEGEDGFDMPEVGIVCADATVAEINGVEAVFEEVAGDDEEVEQALGRILDAFEEVHGLGSLLDVRGTLGDLFEDDSDNGGMQLTLGDDPRESHTLGQVLHSLREAVEEHRESDSFLAQDLRSFVRLLDILAQDYDVALMNPPYGSQNRMPNQVKSYVRENYSYKPEFYLNFFEMAERLSKSKGRIGMLVPRTFMTKKRMQDFREDFVGGRGAFDFLAEFGLGVLDNATVRTAGSVVRVEGSPNTIGKFIRLYDVPGEEKERKFIHSFEDTSQGISRTFDVPLDEFAKIPESPLCYWVPEEIRALHDSKYKIDTSHFESDAESIGRVMQGIATGNNARFVRNHWETRGHDEFRPYTKGGTDAWILPLISKSVYWRNEGEEIRRNSSSSMKNEAYFGRPGLTYTYIKATGRRFGYAPSGGIFDQRGSMLFPENVSPWLLLSVINSDLYHALFLSLTIDREWNIGEVGRIPWQTDFEEHRSIVSLAKEQFELIRRLRTEDCRSPHYVAPALLPTSSERTPFHDHPHVSKIDQETKEVDAERGGTDTISASTPIRDAAREATVRERKLREQVESIAERIDELVFDTLDISAEARDAARQEISLRTGDDPRNRTVPDPQSVPEVPENLDDLVKDLVHHFAMEIVRDEDDGIVPIEARDQSTMYDRIVERFHEVYGEHAEDRLTEVDGILGSRRAETVAYPNLRAFIPDGLFEYHVNQMENTPIIWRLTSERLVSDSEGEGFSCFLDYNSLDVGVLDRLTTQYLEPRRAELRERRSAAQRRQNDESLSTSEQTAAVEEYEFCTNALHQVEELESTFQNLSAFSERDFADEHRDLAADLKSDVEQFREETQTRLEALDRLHEIKGDDWFEDTFSPTFWESVQEEREEWVEALADLEDACEAYTVPSDEPVEAHFADLFDYFSQLAGSDHYSSNGVLFTTYYFEREAEPFLDESGKPKEDLHDEYAELLATVGANLEEYKSLAADIEDDCETLKNVIPTNWADRALSEITTAGYQPNQKHGVVLNVTPLVEAEIVPEIVDRQVI